MLKAAAGGGGKGVRVARNLDELATMFVEAQREALAGFGDGSIYLEKFIGRARHIEVQVLGDGQNVIHLYDRECSLQRRRQKILEEAPAPLLSEEVRERLCAAAVALARSVSYSSAGTIEFLYDDDTGEFFFIEMKLQATREGVVHHIRADDSNPFTSSICTRTFQIAGVRKHPKFTRPSKSHKTSPTA
jgi:acetyl-CoA carboxylase biotin carboxylase subunit